MTDLMTTRWTRYGKDRLYVKTRAGIDVGHIDLLTGAVEVTVAEFEHEVRVLASQQHPAPPDPPSPSAPARVGHDLAANVAGAACKAKREEVNGQAPGWNLVARLLGLKTEERAWRVGAKGEEKVGRKLASLPDEWHVLNAVPIGDRDSDIDHMVIGPGGVFTLNTKRHPDGKVWLSERALLVNGHRTDYLRNSRFEAERVSKLLTASCATAVEVQAVIVFVDLAKLTPKGTPSDVYVTTCPRLRNFLTQQPQRLTQSQVDHIYAVARSSLTWQPA
ncbi:MAG: NERD domain-containing protein [Actinomycetota bacterium]|nr:NERD domain-containing protein [Actinomycetota bacterium]